MKKKEKYYLSGIAGIGMSAIAQYLVNNGKIVFGADRYFDKNLLLQEKKYLKKIGIKICPQDGKILDKDFKACIFSAAVEKNTPDYQKALYLNIPIYSRSKYLEMIYNEKFSIGIAGTSGKTTTTGMLSSILLKTKNHPTILCGGNILIKRRKKKIFNNFFKGDKNTILCEIDESDKAISSYNSNIAVVTNISQDHMNLREAKKLFFYFLNNANTIIFNYDCENTRNIIKKLRNKKLFSFSTKNTNANLVPQKIIYKKNSTLLKIGGYDFKINIPGEYNVENALAAIGCAKQLKIPYSIIAQGLESFKGVEGRFEKLSNKIIYDYAHNPAKLSALLKTATQIYKKIIFFYQPHGFVPFKNQLNELKKIFPNYLRKTDMIILNEIYYIGGTVKKNVSSKILKNYLTTKNINAVYTKNKKYAFKIIKENLPYYEACFIVGARDKTLKNFAQKLFNYLSGSIVASTSSKYTSSPSS